MNIEIINTGTELMLGNILNTHQQWLCRQCTQVGMPPSRQTAVGDDAETILSLLREALARADVIFVTGGLGSTSDDLSRELVAQLFGTRLVENPQVLQHVEQFFAQRNRPMLPRMRLQALVPESAHLFHNQHGLAPGLGFVLDPNPYRPSGLRSCVVLLPGPPRELRPMFHDQVLPWIMDQGVRPELKFTSRTLRTSGLGESSVENRIAGPLQPLIARGLQLGYCARLGEVDVRLAEISVNPGFLLDEAEALVRDALGPAVFGTEEETLEQSLIVGFAKTGRTLAVAESCTGGLIAHRLTNVPGASAVLMAGFVTYSNAAKQKFLGVSEESLRQHGAVSEPVAREMAEGARRQAATDYAVAVTGIAGPSGGSPEKPVGTVFIAVAGPDGTTVIRAYNPYDRESFKQATSQQALDAIRKKALKN